MKLVSFDVTDFRSVNHSTPIEVRQHTALVGRNESGKSSLLKVLHGLKPADEMPTFTLARDFPRDRPRKAFDENAVVVATIWALDDADRAELGEIWPRAGSATSVSVERSYKARHFVEFEGVGELSEHSSAARDAFKDLAKQVKTAGSKAGVAADALTAPLEVQRSTYGITRLDGVGDSSAGRQPESARIVFDGDHSCDGFHFQAPRHDRGSGAGRSGR